MTAPLQRRLMLMVGRAVIEAVDDGQKVQVLQLSLLADEVRDEVERFQEYGFTSVPPKGAEAILVCVAGDRAHGIVIATDDRRYRPKGLAEGESAMWTKDHGKRVHAKSNGEVHIGTAPTDEVALAPATKAEIQAVRDTLNALVTAYNAHIHTTTATVGPSAVVGVIAPTTSQASAPAAVGEIKATEVKAK